ncbi:MAG: hypothetical protein RLZZ433_81 [Pseudomonadota bacterium]|jgi:hypothetical protein
MLLITKLLVNLILLIEIKFHEYQSMVYYFINHVYLKYINPYD